MAGIQGATVDDDAAEVIEEAGAGAVVREVGIVRAETATTGASVGGGSICRTVRFGGRGIRGEVESEGEVDTAMNFFGGICLRALEELW